MGWQQDEQEFETFGLKSSFRSDREVASKVCALCEAGTLLISGTPRSPVLTIRASRAGVCTAG